MLLTGFITEHTGISGSDEIDESGNVQKPKQVIPHASALIPLFMNVSFAVKIPWKQSQNTKQNPT